MDTLRKRYFYKLFTNLIGLLIGFGTAAIIPRGLGPKAYGDFNFLTNFFNQITGFLDMGTSIGFYTKLSQRQREFGLVSFYIYFSLIISVLVLFFVFVSNSISIHKTLWPDQQMFFVWLAAILGFLAWFLQVFTKILDAYGLTVPTEKARILQKILGLVAILILFVFQQIKLTQFFIYQYCIVIFLLVAFIRVSEKSGFSFRQDWKLPMLQIKKYTKEFYKYSHPLFIYALIGLIVGILDRWLLQLYSGSVQQGFYSLSYNIGAICFLFTSAMTPLLMREFAVLYGKNDMQEMARLFRRYIPMLYSIAAYFSCFIAVQAEKVIYIFGGKGFKGAIMAVTIMSFYPIHQTYGQLSGSVFYATGQTGLYRNIGITMMLLGLPMTYLLIAPKNKWGLDMGAEGLAVKMIAIQFIGVNVFLYFNSRFLKLSFWKYFAHQIICVGSLLLMAFLSLNVVKYFHISSNIVINFLLNGIIYTTSVAALIYFVPSLFGLARKDIHAVFQRLSKGIRGWI